MNIEEKTKLAHEYLLRFSGTTVADAWQYADAMEAEAEKRIKAEAKEKREAVRKLLSDDGTFLEKEGMHFDDVATLCNTYSSSEWQPDWSVAPSWAEYFAVDENTEGWFFIQEPTIDVDGCWYCVGGSYMAFSHDYQGNWEDSLRKRPE